MHNPHLNFPLWFLFPSAKTYQVFRLFTFFTVVSIIIRSSIQVLYVPLCPQALLWVTSLADRCIAHISSSAPSEQGAGPCRAAGAQRCRSTGDRPGGGSLLCSAPRPRLPDSLPRAVPCPGEPETPATAGSGRWPCPIQALPGYFYTYQASYACQWRGVGRGTALQHGAGRPGSQSYSPAGWNALHTRVIELPTCVPFNVLIFSLPCSVSLCLHKALKFGVLLMPSEFLTQKCDSFKPTIRHLFGIYKPR